MLAHPTAGTGRETHLESFDDSMEAGSGGGSYAVVHVGQHVPPAPRGR